MKKIVIKLVKSILVLAAIAVFLFLMGFFDPSPKLKVGPFPNSLDVSVLKDLERGDLIDIGESNGRIAYVALNGHDIIRICFSVGEQRFDYNHFMLKGRIVAVYMQNDTDKEKRAEFNEKARQFLSQ